MANGPRTKYSKKEAPTFSDMELAASGMMNLGKQNSNEYSSNPYNQYVADEYRKEMEEKLNPGSQEWSEKSSGKIDLSPVNVEDAFLLPYLGTKAILAKKAATSAASRALPKYTKGINLTHPRAVRYADKMKGQLNKSGAVLGTTTGFSALDYME